MNTKPETFSYILTEVFNEYDQGAPHGWGRERRLQRESPRVRRNLHREMTKGGEA